MDECCINIEQGFLLLKLILSINSHCPIPSQISIALRVFLIFSFIFKLNELHEQQSRLHFRQYVQGLEGHTLVTCELCQSCQAPTWGRAQRAHPLNSPCHLPWGCCCCCCWCKNYKMLYPLGHIKRDRDDIINKWQRA